MSTIALWAYKHIDTHCESFSSILRTEDYSRAQLNMSVGPKELP